MWIVYRKEKVGKSHIKTSTPCQDKTFYLDKNDIKSLVLCDGAGSAKFSHFGADIVTKSLATFLCDNFDNCYDNNDALQIKREIINFIFEKLNSLKDFLGCELKELASTLQFVAIKDDRFILCHLGDGVVGYVKNGLLKVASTPINGEFANATSFTISKDAISKMKLFKGKIDFISAFVLMSDGSAEAFYKKQIKKFSKGLEKLIDYSKFSLAFDDILSNALANIQKVTTDDVSLAFLVKENSFNYIKFKKMAQQNLNNRVLKRRFEILAVLTKPLTITQIYHKVAIKRHFIYKDLDYLHSLALIKKSDNFYLCNVNLKKEIK